MYFDLVELCYDKLLTEYGDGWCQCSRTLTVYMYLHLHLYLNLYLYSYLTHRTLTSYHIRSPILIK